MLFPEIEEVEEESCTELGIISFSGISVSRDRWHFKTQIWKTLAYIEENVIVAQLERNHCVRKKRLDHSPLWLWLLPDPKEAKFASKLSPH